MQSFPRHHTDRDEPDDVRAARLEVIADAIDAAVEVTKYPASKRELRGLLLVTARNESHLARYVYEYRCSDGPNGKYECDSGRATGLFQGHHSKTGSVHEDARIAARRFARAARLCEGTNTDDRVNRAIANYAIGSGCQWQGSAKRTKEWRKVARELGGVR